ncbi:MAG: YggS family pyridoxal phosphate-dependent enzyme [Ignavibacteria bacterium]|nr:YggS family pyridoxal phosphate-dependent enzyme [Ignavibacteria bacterium]MBI3764944.1 YggS family pyridoxal phosphate-dependent enzyme [Ignavibacteriales bacterium]
MIAENVRNIRQRIHSACLRVGRTPEEVTLVAVTKSFAVSSITQVLDAGVADIGENYVQELLQKRDELRAKDVRWHFIGHLQSNKVKHIAEWVHLVHAVDSLSLGKQISRCADAFSRSIDVMIEVNTTGEKSKFGVDVDMAPTLIRELASLPRMNVVGLMTIGPFLPDPEASRPAFRTLRELKRSLESDGVSLPFLSMGMTNDFEVAIEEGATHVRVGTAIFGARVKAA